ncbi:hypothetical protein M405DRAFT_838130 [Rhizopogon salebrosus TDB-379]|nr:hypothetical protein M405DRAFT_838130 [Rhizopogon salebrosus TDB-379]
MEVLNRKVSMVNGLACRDFTASTNWTFTICQFSPASARRGAFIHFERHSLIICFRPHRIHSPDLHNTPMPSSPIRTLLTEKTLLKHPGHQRVHSPNSPRPPVSPSSERRQTRSKTRGDPSLRLYLLGTNRKVSSLEENAPGTSNLFSQVLDSYNEGPTIDHNIRLKLRDCPPSPQYLSSPKGTLQCPSSPKRAIPALQHFATPSPVPSFHFNAPKRALPALQHIPAPSPHPSTPKRTLPPSQGHPSILTRQNRPAEPQRIPVLSPLPTTGDTHLGDFTASTNWTFATCQFPLAETTPHRASSRLKDTKHAVRHAEDPRLQLYLPAASLLLKHGLDSACLTPLVQDALEPFSRALDVRCQYRKLWFSVFQKYVSVSQILILNITNLLKECSEFQTLKCCIAYLLVRTLTAETKMQNLEILWTLDFRDAEFQWRLIGDLQEKHDSESFNHVMLKVISKIQYIDSARLQCFKETATVAVGSWYYRFKMRH